ncbi:LysE family transporter [Bacillus sp. JCM 19041]|uniref:LysE family translocator n=1 Tax=Bacillus sp. JCM 19041 TaxID=1460637 RepID=UPI0006D17FAD
MTTLSFILYCFIVTVTPGPTNIVIVSVVQNNGVHQALRYTYGATIAFGLLLTASAIFNTLFMHALPKILFFMQLVGSLYMLYLAYQVYKMDLSKKQTTAKHASFLSGFLMQFLNPKVVLFTMTVIPSFILPYYVDPTTVSLSVLGITFIGFLAFLLWVGFGAMFKELFRTYQKTTNLIMALFLVYAAIMIWV